MQKLRRFSLRGLYLGAIFLMLSAGFAFAQQIPHLITYKGDIKELAKDDGKVDKDEKEKKDKDVYNLTFRIYNLEIGGAALWEETHLQVPIKKGNFEVILGSIIPLDLKFDEDYWLSIEVDGEGEIIPRERMTSVGYAYMSDDTWKLGGRYFEEYALIEHNHLGEDIITPVAEAVNADTVDGLHADQLGGIKDHGLLEGLADDDHLQYLNILRGDERYAGSGWDGLTRLKTAQDHIADLSNPHAVTLEQLGHLDNNPEEEAPTATERGEPTGIEIQGWADDIVSWGHSNLVANLNADKLDGKDSSEFSLLGHFHTLMDLSDVTFDLRAAFLAAGAAGASETNRLATMTDLIATSGLWTDGGDYIYPSNTDRRFKITDTGNLLMSHGNVGIGMENPSRLLQVGSNSHSSGQGILVDGVLSLAWGEVGIPAPEIGLVSLWHEKTSPIAGYLGMKFFNDNVPFVVTSDGNVGINTSAPNAKLHVNKDSGANHTEVARFVAANPGAMPYITVGNSNTGGENAPTCGGGYFAYDNPTGTVMIGEHCNQPAIIVDAGNVGIGTMAHQGTLDVNGPIYQRGAVLHADYVFESDYKLESIDEHAKFMWQEKHLKAVPRAVKTEEGQEIMEMGSRQRGVLEELEKAHIYIAQLNERIKKLEAKLEKQ